MSLDTHGPGGVRPGAGRPKKKVSELQKTHSIRATDKDWKNIQVAARIIKANKSKVKRPRVLLLDDDELDNVNRFLIEGIIDRHHDRMWGKEEVIQAPEPAQPVIEIQKPKSVSEEEAVSLFLEYYRLNPIDATTSVQSKLDREKHLQELREFRSKQKKVMSGLEDKVDDALKSIDDINERVARMLQFPGYKK